MAWQSCTSRGMSMAEDTSWPQSHSSTAVLAGPASRRLGLGFHSLDWRGEQGCPAGSRAGPHMDSAMSLGPQAEPQTYTPGLSVSTGANSLVWQKSVSLSFTPREPASSLNRGEGVWPTESTTMLNRRCIRPPASAAVVINRSPVLKSCFTTGTRDRVNLMPISTACR